MHNDRHSAIKRSILAKIENGEALMRPRWHFVLKGMLCFFGVFLVALALLYLASFIVFVLRQTGVLYVPAFGMRGISVFLLSIPWLLVLLAIVFLVVLEILVTRFSFAHRRPLLYSVAAILLFVGIGTMVVSRFNFHVRLFHSAREFNLPVAGPFYRGYGKGVRMVHPGTIHEFVDDGFRMSNPRGQVLRVIILRETRFPYGAALETGDMVIVFGPLEDETIRAVGIRMIESGAVPYGHVRPFSPQ
jgi:hypothetical protein